MSLAIHNIAGQKVKTPVDEVPEPGFYEAAWKGKNDNGQNLAAGVYVYRLDSGTFSDIRKMVILR